MKEVTRGSETLGVFQLAITFSVASSWRASESHVAAIKRLRLR
jgi:hypothetical protein